MDDYKEEILERLNKSTIYQTLVEKCGNKDSEVIALVDNVVQYSYSKAKTILTHIAAQITKLRQNPVHNLGTY